jgi:hypothetical protein
VKAVSKFVVIFASSNAKTMIFHTNQFSAKHAAESAYSAVMKNYAQSV